MQPLRWAMAGISLLCLVGLQACATPGNPVACLVPVTATHAAPIYPPISQRLGEYGTTGLSVGVGADGLPVQVAITHRSGSMRLDIAAVAHILQYYRWQPLAAGCDPAAARSDIVVTWRLEEAPGVIQVAMGDADSPAGAIARGEAGDTIVDFFFDAKGVLKEARVANGSGYADLDAQALAILKSRRDLATGKPGATQRLLARWTLPADGTTEILDVRAKRLVLQGFTAGTPP